MNKAKIKYQVNKQECQKRINELNYVCDYCGRKIKPIKTVNNAGEPTYWQGCTHGGECGHFTSGVSKWIYELAVKLVQDNDLYWRMKYEDKVVGFDYAYQNAVRRACELISNIEYIKTHTPRFTKKQLIEDYKKYFVKGEK